MSELGLGTWGLSGDGYGPVDDAEQERVLERAFDIGFTLVDTADAYAAGRMERLIGRVARGRDDIVVASKGGIDRSTSPPRKRFDAAYLRAALERSLRRLDRERIEIYLLHGPHQAAIDDDALVALKDLKSQGKIGCWGVSTGDVNVGRVALRAGAEVIELPYNLVQPSDLHRLAGEIMVAGAGVLARSTLAYGLLGGSWRKDREFEAGDHRAHRWTRPELERRIDQLSAMHFLMGRDVPNLASAAVRFVLSNAIVSSAVLGPRTVAQLEGIVRDVGMGPVYLREGDLSRLPRTLESVGIES